MSPKIVLIPLASLAVIGAAALLHQRTSPSTAPICIQTDRPVIEVTPEPDDLPVPPRRFARPPSPPPAPPSPPHAVPVA